MKIFVFNMKKYRKKRRLSQMKLAEMLDTSTSYIGEIEINSRVPSIDMVERIAKALEVEPYRLFIDDSNRTDGNILSPDSYLECLSSTERHDLAKRIISSITTGVEQILRPENIPD